MSSSSGFKVVSSYIARWALPNEGIPLFLLWEGELDFDLIEIKMPESFIVRDYYNVTKKYLNPSEIRVDELKTLGYIGLVFTSPLMESISQEAKIILNFTRGSEVIHQQEFETRIVRPKIELQVPEGRGLPSSIFLRDVWVVNYQSRCLV